jgi:DNA-directed RNA polymerase subunit RPC12/RpoP
MRTAGDRQYPCSQCGADLRFAPGQTELRCDHCGHVQAIPAAGAGRRKAALGELDLYAALNAGLPEAAMEETRVLACPSCGAQVEVSEAAHARAVVRAERVAGLCPQGAQDGRALCALLDL